MIRKLTITCICLFFFSGVAMATYDYQYVPCFDKDTGTWSSENYCDDLGIDCPEQTPHPCPPDSPQQ